MYEWFHSIYNDRLEAHIVEIITFNILRKDQCFDHS